MAEVRQVVVTADGPVLLTGPVEVVLPDGRRVRSDRPLTALCVCRRSRRAPFCDTSHRRKVRPTDGPPAPTGAPGRADDAPAPPGTDDPGEDTRAQPHPSPAR
jgi:CDGSH-type Zn-finger protein